MISIQAQLHCMGCGSTRSITLVQYIDGKFWPEEGELYCRTKDGNALGWEEWCLEKTGPNTVYRHEGPFCPECVAVFVEGRVPENLKRHNYLTGKDD